MKRTLNQTKADPSTSSSSSSSAAVHGARFEPRANEVLFQELQAITKLPSDLNALIADYAQGPFSTLIQHKMPTFHEQSPDIWDITVDTDQGHIIAHARTRVGVTEAHEFDAELNVIRLAPGVPFFAIRSGFVYHGKIVLTPSRSDGGTYRCTGYLSDDELLLDQTHGTLVGHCREGFVMYKASSGLLELRHWVTTEIIWSRKIAASHKYIKAHCHWKDPVIVQTILGWGDELQPVPPTSYWDASGCLWILHRRAVVPVDQDMFVAFDEVRGFFQLYIHRKGERQKTVGQRVTFPGERNFQGVYNPFNNSLVVLSSTAAPGWNAGYVCVRLFK